MQDANIQKALFEHRGHSLGMGSSRNTTGKLNIYYSMIMQPFFILISQLSNALYRTYKQ